MFFSNLLQLRALLVSSVLIANLSLMSAAKIPVSVGDSICVAGYVMDYYCIERETLFDNNSIKTLSSEGPTAIV